MKSPSFFTIVLAYGLSFMLSSCGQTGTSFQRSFISSYVEPELINMEENTNSNLVTFPLILQVSGKHHPQGTTLHNVLSDKYKDKSYKKHTTPNLALSEEIVWIDLIAMTDLSAAFPAGSSLREHAVMAFSSYYSYVKGGYKDENLLRIIEKRICDFSSDELKMLNQHISLVSLGIESEKLGTNRLKLYIEFDSGRSQELEFTY